MSAYDWMDDSACREYDPEVFFPMPSDTPAVNKARAICGGCPVLERCARKTIDVKHDYGVSGGMSEYARRRVRRLGPIERERELQAALDKARRLASE